MVAVLAAVVAYFVGGGGATLEGTWRGLLIFFAPRTAVSLVAVVVPLLKRSCRVAAAAPMASSAFLGGDA
jgi:hypothetical protein